MDSKVPFFTEAIKNFFKSPVTNKYPNIPVEAPKNYRGKIKFDSTLCVGCGMCIKVCSPGAITKTIEKVDEGQKITMNFNLGSCTYCGFCADFCGRKAIKLTQDYHLVITDKNELMETGSFIKKLPPKPPLKAAEAAVTK